MTMHVVAFIGLLFGVACGSLGACILGGIGAGLLWVGGVLVLVVLAVGIESAIRGRP